MMSTSLITLACDPAGTRQSNSLRSQLWRARRDSVTGNHLLMIPSTPARRRRACAFRIPSHRKLFTTFGDNQFSGVPGGIRTPDFSVRNATFYPLNYGHKLLYRDYTLIRKVTSQRRFYLKQNRKPYQQKFLAQIQENRCTFEQFL